MRSRILLAMGGTLAGAFLLLALISLVWVPYPVEALAITERLKTPSTAHLLGTDHFGRDILSMIMVGARTSIAVALVAVVIGLGLGVPLGLYASAHRGSLIDDIIMRGNDLVFAFPPLVLAILLTAVLGPSAVNAILAIAIFFVPVLARVTRGAALPIWTLDYVRAARVAGKGNLRIAVEHVLPNIANVLIVQGTIQFSVGIIFEAALSFVGLGAQPPVPSWGRMLVDAQTLVAVAPHMAVFPGLAIVLTVLGLNLVGDGLRDLLDPRLRRAR